MSRETAQHRAQLRQRIGRLSRNVVQPNTMKRYNAACTFFFRWLVSMGIRLPKTWVGFDLLLCQFIDDAWENGEPRGLVGDLLSGLGNSLPALKSRMTGAWRLHTAWGRYELPSRAPPFSVLMVQAFAGLVLSWGFPDVALLVLLMFHAILRTSDIFQARGHDFTFGPDHRSGILVLPHSKTGTRRGIIESVVLQDEGLTLALWRFVSTRPAAHKLLLRSQAQFRAIFKAAVKELGLPENFKPYSARRGGATNFFQLTGSLDQTADRGRWGSITTARIYINVALLDSAQQELSAEITQRLEQFSSHLARVLGI